VKRILWCGDSTMTGAVRAPDGIFRLTDSNEMRVCTDLLLELHGEGCVQSTNAAYGGTTTQDWVLGNAAIGMPDFSTRMYQNQLIDIVVVQLGINDAFNPGITVDLYKWNIARMYQIAEQWGKDIVFATPSPINRPENSKLWDLQHNLKYVAAGLGVRVIDHYVAATSVGPCWEQCLPDGIHPDEYLYRFKGHTSFLALRDRVV